MGSLLGGGTTTTNSNQSTSSSTSPWAPQATQVQNLFGQAQQNEQQQASNGPYQGNYVAGQNPYQSAANSNEFNNAGNVQNSGNGQLTLGNGLLSQTAPAYVSNADGLYGNSALTANGALTGALSGYATGTGGGLSSALNSAAISGTQALGSAQSTLGQVQQTGLANQTGTLAADAGQYMNSAPIQSAINSTNAGIAQTLDEQTEPGLNQAAAAGGSVNSSRAGAASAEAQGQAALAQGTADASIQNNAYNTGLGTALSSYESGLNSANSAATAAGSLGNSSSLGTAGLQTGAASTGLSQNLNYGEDSFQNALGANAQLGAGINYANSTLNSGASNLATGAQMQQGAGTSQYGTDQAGLTNAIDQYTGSNNYMSGVLGQYQGLISGNYGSQSTGTSSGTTTQQQPQNILGSLAGIGLAGAGLYSDFGGSSALGGLFGAGNSTIEGYTPTGMSGLGMGASNPWASVTLGPNA